MRATETRAQRARWCVVYHRFCILSLRAGRGVCKGIIISVVTSGILSLRLLRVEECEDESVSSSRHDWAKHEYRFVTVTKV